MYNDLFEKTFSKHRKLVLELLNVDLEKMRSDEPIVDDPDWTDKVDWVIIANTVDFNNTKPLEDFLGLNENNPSDKRRVGEYINHVTDRFQRDFENLPEQIKKSSVEYYRLFLQDPTIGKLRFHNLGTNNVKMKNYVAINAGNANNKTYRSVGIVVPDRTDPNLKHIKWFFIGGHAQYDDLLSRLKKK